MAEMIEGPQAKENFERAMKALFRVSKAQSRAAELSRKSKRKRCKADAGSRHA
jgi:hypothetical protein